METSNNTHRGQAVYSKGFLSVYDWLVLGVSNTYIWCCNSVYIVRLYKNEITKDHLDVGVGTGYFLSQSGVDRFDRIGLMDLNKNSLDSAASSINGITVKKYHLDVLSDICLKESKYNSVSINYLLHCLPGTIESKAKVIDNLIALLKDGGVIFGSTIVGKGVKHGFKARVLMWIYNKVGIFSNKDDSLEALSAILNERFSNVEIKTVGSVALFTAKNIKN